MFTSTIFIENELLEPPVNGTVSSLIAAGKLFANSATDSNIEKITIHGVLDVNENYTFDGTGAPGTSARPQLYLGPGSQILVRSGVTLTLLNTDIYTCDELASGITLEPGATLLATTSLFNDCRFAIDARPGSSVSLVGNSFSDNYIGLNLDMRSATTSTPKRVNILAMTGNSFSTAQPAIKAPYSGMPEAVEARGYCGVRLIDYQDFNVFGTNTFASLANGIVSTNSTGNVGGMSFDDMNSVDGTPIYPQEGYGIYLTGKGSHWFNIGSPFSTMTFNNCKTGIRAGNYAGKVENTAMTDVNIGIDWGYSHARDIRMLNNNITARDFGIRSGLNEPLHPISAITDNEIKITGALAPGNFQTSGIVLNEIGFGYTPPGGTVPAGLEGWDVGGNMVTLDQGGIGIGYRNGVLGTLHENTVVNLTQPAEYTGILAEAAMFSDLTANTVTQSGTGLGTSTAIHSSAGFANTYQCNCVDSTDIGLLFLDLAEFTDAVRGNSMNTHCTGLQINAGAYIGEQYHSGNIWDLSAVAGNCLGGRNFSNVLLSPFFVDGTSNDALNPEVWPDETWFKDESGPTYDDCTTCTFPAFLPPRNQESAIPTKLDEALATDKLYPELFEDEMNWKGAFRLYRKMLRQPAIESYATEFADFKADNDSLSTGRLAYIAEERSKIFSFSAVEDSLLENYRLDWHTEMADLMTLDSLRHQGDTTISHAQYDTAVVHGKAAYEQYVHYLDTLKAAARAKIQTLLTTNAAISTALTPAENHKTVNAIVFNLLLVDTLATGDLATLESIAGLCPLEGGDAVYEARTIVSYLTGANFDDVELCQPAEEIRRPEEPEVIAGDPANIIIFPNPSTGHVYWRGTGNQKIRILVFNAYGQQLADMFSTSGFADMKHLPEGLHLVQLLSSDNRLLATRKLHLITH
ncbi:MAG: T9SS type A sorting domain-containing protein [Lewinellaceae bacterium]|nr:T9SS type A sorting domain-containing protein [Lewinellaceae bacterium]